MYYCEDITSIIKKDHSICLRNFYKINKRIYYDDCVDAARYGSFNCLKFIINNNIYTKHDDKANNDLICARASQGGNIKCLRFLHKKGYKMDYLTCTFAAQSGSIECISYALKNGCTIEDETIGEAIEYGNTHIIKFLNNNHIPMDKLCHYAAKFNNESMLEYAHIKGYKWDENVASIASKNCDLDNLEYILKNGCPTDDRVCKNLAKSNHLLMLYIAHSKYSCKLTIDATRTASKHGSLECLIYLISNDCPYTNAECSIIQKNNKYYCILKYKHAIHKTDMEYMQYI